MRRALVLVAASLWFTVVGSPQASSQHASADPSSNASTSRALVTQYCVTCHNERTKAGDLALDGVDFSNLSANAGTLEKIVRKLRAGMMPRSGHGDRTRPPTTA